MSINFVSYIDALFLIFYIYRIVVCYCVLQNSRSSTVRLATTEQIPFPIEQWAVSVPKSSQSFYLFTKETLWTVSVTGRSCFRFPLNAEWCQLRTVLDLFTHLPKRLWTVLVTDRGSFHFSLALSDACFTTAKRFLHSPGQFTVYQ